METKKHKVCFITAKNKKGELKIWRAGTGSTKKALKVAKVTPGLKDMTIEKVEIKEMEFPLK